MKFIAITALGASLAGAAPVPSALESLLELTTEQVEKFEILTLGGMTLRAEQVHNQGFMTSGRGPRAYLQSLRKYTQFGATIDPSLLCIVDKILQELGLSSTNVPDSCTSTTGSSSTSSGGSGGGQNPPNSTATPSSPSTGSASAIPQANDVEYLTPVQIGTPPQTVMLDFDTGSSDLWVFTTQTPQQQSQGHQLYNPDSSSTASQVANAEFQIQYGDGSGASGTVFRDVVTVGGVSVQDQAVEGATMVTGSFTEDQATSGLLGLAMDSINQVTDGGTTPNPQKTFFSNAMGNLAMPLFTANLKQGTTGNYNFGFVDESEFTGSVNFVAVNSSQGFWQFAASGFAVGQGAATALPHQAIADTGTTLMLMPDEAVEAYYQQIPSAQNSQQQGGVVFNCNDTIPSFTAVISGYQAVVPGDIIKFAPVTGDSTETSELCFGGIQSNSGLGFAIYGDIFLKAQFTVFDGGNMRIGFAAKSDGNF